LEAGGIEPPAAHEEKVTALSTQLRDLTSKVDGQLRDRDFQGARTTLQAIEANIVNVGDYSLRDQYDQAMAKVASAERDHTEKVSDGWAVFEGRFISPAEKQKILADRERKRQEEARRAERERQLAEERRKREAAEQQRREEQRRAEQNRRPSYEYKIVADEKQDTPGKSQVMLKVVVQTALGKPELQSLLQSLFDDARQRRGFKFRQHPNAVYIYAYGPNADPDGGALWIGMASYNENNGDSKPEISISDSRLEAAFEKPKVKAGLTEAQRKKVFWESVAVEDRAMKALERGNSAEYDRIKEEGERELRRKYGLTEEELTAIGIEGVTKGWPMP
jgi:murein DD-endopeptidase MepM/ murein hydrolase activator NlpD